MKKILTFIVLSTLFVFIFIYLPIRMFEDQEPIQITRQLDLPTDDVQLVLQADNVSSFELLLSEFKNRQFEGVSSVGVERLTTTGKTSTVDIIVYARESGTNFHAHLESIEIPKWSFWGVNMGDYYIVDETIDSGVLNLTLHPRMGVLGIVVVLAVAVVLILTAILIDKIWPNTSPDKSS